MPDDDIRDVKTAAWIIGHRVDLRTDAGKQLVDLVAEALRDERARSASTLESLQRDNEALKKDRYDLAYAITGGEDAPGLLDSVPTTQLVEIARDTHRSHSADIDRAMAAEADVKNLRDRYERWMPVTDAPPAGLHPDALLHFYCILDEVGTDESPEYWKTDTWQDKPADSVYWCAIVSPLGPPRNNLHRTPSPRQHRRRTPCRVKFLQD